MQHTEQKVRPYHPALAAEWVVAPDLPSDTVPPAEKTTTAPRTLSLEREPEPRYITQWRGNATLEDILTDKNVKNVAFAKMRSFGYTDQDAEDCFQLGSINFWKTLKDQPTLLCDKRAAWVGVWIALSGSRRTLWKHKARNIPLDVAYHYGGNRPERWAGFATRIDEKIDFELLMGTLAQQYDGDPLKLYALYLLTTSVNVQDVLSVAGVDKNTLLTARNVVKTDMRNLLEQDREVDVSQEVMIQQIRRGDHLECVTRVAERVMDNERLLLALYIVTTSAKRKDVTRLFGIGKTWFRREVQRIKQMLVEELRKGHRRRASSFPK